MFQSPEGDSGLCYLARVGFVSMPNDCFSPPKGIQVSATLRRRTRSLFPSRFQSPEGDSGLCYQDQGDQNPPFVGVSVPRRGFRSLLLSSTRSLPVSPLRFQSPEGDSGLCYNAGYGRFSYEIAGFSPPKGIQVSATWQSLCGPPAPESVSVPRRGFRSLLPQSPPYKKTASKPFLPIKWAMAPPNTPFSSSFPLAKVIPTTPLRKSFFAPRRGAFAKAQGSKAAAGNLAKHGPSVSISTLPSPLSSLSVPRTR